MAVPLPGLDLVVSRGAGTRAARCGRRALMVGVGLGAVALTGCSPETTAQLGRLGLPEAASDRAPEIGRLWIGTWIAAGVIGVLTLVLILWAALRYRNRGPETPKQTRYNLPVEIMYTAAPFIIIGVLFFHTIVVQNRVLAPAEQPAHTVEVVGWKWSWTFNYLEESNSAVGANVWESGTIERTPTLYLPVNEPVKFILTSPDVNHSFWVPAFYFKMDVIPGRTNSFTLTPTKEGTFAGKCNELCGTYHSAMLFNVKVVSQAEFNAELLRLKDAGQTGVVRGPEDVRVIKGTEPEGKR